MVSASRPFRHLPARLAAACRPRSGHCVALVLQPPHAGVIGRTVGAGRARTWFGGGGKSKLDAPIGQPRRSPGLLHPVPADALTRAGAPPYNSQCITRRRGESAMEPREPRNPL